MNGRKTMAQMEADDSWVTERIRSLQVSRMDEREHGVCAREIKKIAQCLYLDARSMIYVLSIHDVQMHMPRLSACLRTLKDMSD